MKARDIIFHVGLPLDDIVAGMNGSWLESIPKTPRDITMRCVPRLVAQCDLRTHQGMIPEAVCWGATRAEFART
jgi:hypothetical protein